MKAKINIKNIIAYIQGNIRYKLYYSKFKWLIRKHIREQIDFRIKVMDRECYNNGSCKLCGCRTTALQMANKACDKPCYPEMMDKIDWFFFNEIGTSVTIKDSTWILQKQKDDNNKTLVSLFKDGILIKTYYEEF